MGVDLTDEDHQKLAELGKRHIDELNALLEKLGLTPDCMVRVIFNPEWKTTTDPNAIRVVSTLSDPADLCDIFTFLAGQYAERLGRVDRSKLN